MKKSLLLIALIFLSLQFIGCLDTVSVKTPHAAYDRSGKDVAVEVEEGAADNIKGILLDVYAEESLPTGIIK